jgi:hypothetical protein
VSLYSRDFDAHRPDVYDIFSFSVAQTNSPSDWEPLKASATSGPIMVSDVRFCSLTPQWQTSRAVQGISWGPYMRGLMCVWHDKKAEILNETELHRKVVGKMAGVQIGSTDVVIQETGGAMNTLHAGIPVRVRLSTAYQPHHSSVLC